MKIPSSHIVANGLKGQVGASQAKKPGAATTPEMMKLKKACQEFEAIFISYMLKSMRQGAEKSELFGDGLGSEIYKDIFDEKLADEIASTGQMKIGDALYNKYLPLIGGQKATARPEIKPIAPPSTPIQVSGSIQSPVPEKAIPQSDEIGVVTEIVTDGPILVNPAVLSDNTRVISDVTTPPKPVDQGSESAPLLAKFEDMIVLAAEKFGLEPALLRAVIAHESGGNPNATSSQGAKGLMQLIDSTARMLGVVDPFNPLENIMGGARYLSQLIDRFGGDLEKALASYNAGPGAVEKYDGIPPYKETRNYVEKVMTTFNREQNNNPVKANRENNGS